MHAEAEFTRLVAPDAISATESIQEIEADAEERAALARRFGLVSLDRLSARLRLRREDAIEQITVSGEFEAEVTQSCVVSLEPICSRVADSIEWRYSLAPELQGDSCMGDSALGGLEPASPDPEVWVDVDAADPPEPVGPGGIDLGEALAQQLSVALDPFPRAPAAALESLGWRDESCPDESSSPFSVLRQLRREE